MPRVPRRSPPSRAAWIEITRSAARQIRLPASPPSRAAWIEIQFMLSVCHWCPSPPSWGGVDDALLLCDLLSLGIFLNQKQGYCILDAATLFSEKTVIGEQRYPTDNVYRLSHIAVFVKIFLRKWLPLCRRTNAAKTCRHNQVNTNMLLSAEETKIKHRKQQA